MGIEKYRCPWLANDFRTTVTLRGERDIEALVDFDGDLNPKRLMCPGYNLPTTGKCKYRTIRTGASGNDAGTLEYMECIVKEGWQTLGEQNDR